MTMIRFFMPAVAATLAVVLSAGFTGASYAAAPTEQVNIVGTRTSAPNLPTPAEAQIDKDGLLKNGLVANENSYG